MKPQSLKIIMTHATVIRNNDNLRNILLVTNMHITSGRPKMAPTALDRTFLIWSGHYKTKAEIPASLE